jgi:hypothetical protein
MTDQAFPTPTGSEDDRCGEQSARYPAGPGTSLTSWMTDCCRPVPGPRPRRQVIRSVQRGLSDRGRQGDPHADPSASRQRLRRAVGENGAKRMPGLDPGTRDPTSQTGPARLRRHYNDRRPHRGLYPAAPGDRESLTSQSIRSRRLDRRDLLGGLIHEYELAA